MKYKEVKTPEHIANEIAIQYSNGQYVRIVRQFYTFELVGGTEKMREMAVPIAERFQTFIMGKKL